jgi:hypothetical protein
MWFKVDAPPTSLRVYVGSQRFQTTIGRDLITTAVSGSDFESLVAAPALLDVYFYDVVRNEKQYVGEFVISE